MSEVELPQGWVQVAVQDLAADEPAALTDGPFGSNLKTSHYVDAGPRVIRLQNIGEDEFLDDRAYISQAHFERLRRHEAAADDVIVALLGARLPRACRVPATLGPAIVKADCARLRVERRLVLPSYVAAGLNSRVVRAQADALVHGVGRPRIGLKGLRALWLPVAPLPEQHRIVSALDSYFSRLDAAEAALQRVEANLKRYRASVLKAAVEGRLVPTEAELARKEGRDYEPASVLLDRILVERRRKWEEAELAKMVAKGKPPGNDKWKAKYKEPTPPDTDGLPQLPEGWCWASVDQLGQVVTGSTPSTKRPEYYGGEIPFVTPPALGSAIVGSVVQHLTPAGAEVGRVVPAGSVLVCCIGSLGKAAMARRDVAFNQQLNAVVPAVARLGRWLLLVVGGDAFREEMRVRSTSTTVTLLNKSRFQEIPVPVPPFAEVLRVCDESDRLLGASTQVAEGMQRNGFRCKRLRQSILKWAFEGRLVDQDPTDEPASVLLERIRAEREAADAKPRAKRATRKRKAKS